MIIFHTKHLTAYGCSSLCLVNNFTIHLFYYYQLHLLPQSLTKQTSADTLKYFLLHLFIYEKEHPSTHSLPIINRYTHLCSGMPCRNWTNEKKKTFLYRKKNNNKAANKEERITSRRLNVRLGTTLLTAEQSAFNRWFVTKTKLNRWL